jgi:hypothetical protein
MNLTSLGFPHVDERVIADNDYRRLQQRGYDELPTPLTPVSDDVPVNAPDGLVEISYRPVFSEQYNWKHVSVSNPFSTVMLAYINHFGFQLDGPSDTLAVLPGHLMGGPVDTPVEGVLMAALVMTPPTITPHYVAKLLLILGLAPCKFLHNTIEMHVVNEDGSAVTGTSTGVGVYMDTQLNGSIHVHIIWLYEVFVCLLEWYTTARHYNKDIMMKNFVDFLVNVFAFLKAANVDYFIKYAFAEAIVMISTKREPLTVQLEDITKHFETRLTRLKQLSPWTSPGQQWVITRPVRIDNALRDVGITKITRNCYVSVSTGSRHRPWITMFGPILDAARIVILKTTGVPIPRDVDMNCGEERVVDVSVAVLQHYVEEIDESCVFLRWLSTKHVLRWICPAVSSLLLLRRVCLDKTFILRHPGGFSVNLSDVLGKLDPETALDILEYVARLAPQISWLLKYVVPVDDTKIFMRTGVVEALGRLDSLQVERYTTLFKGDEQGKWMYHVSHCILTLNQIVLLCGLLIEICDMGTGVFSTGGEVPCIAYLRHLILHASFTHTIETVDGVEVEKFEPAYTQFAQLDPAVFGPLDGTMSDISPTYGLFAKHMGVALSGFMSHIPGVALEQVVTEWKFAMIQLLCLFVPHVIAITRGQAQLPALPEDHRSEGDLAALIIQGIDDVIKMNLLRRGNEELELSRADGADEGDIEDDMVEFSDLLRR